MIMFTNIWWSGIVKFSCNVLPSLCTQSNRIKSEHAPLLSTAETKLLFVLSLSISAGILIFVLLLTVRITVRTQTSLVLDYFKCESDGYVPGKCNRAALEQEPIVWFVSTYIYFSEPRLSLIFFLLSSLKKWKKK